MQFSLHNSCANKVNAILFAQRYTVVMFFGRQAELLAISDRLHDTTKAQLIVIYGRRRIGKSRLIREALKSEQRTLFFEGIEGEQTPVQIAQFTDDLARQTGRVRLAARSWREAFQGLRESISRYRRAYTPSVLRLCLGATGRRRDGQGSTISRAFTG